MNSAKKWLFVFAAILIVGSMFADRIITFYLDWLWFDSHQIDSVLLTMILAQFGVGLLAGGLFFAITYAFLSKVYRQTSHIPVVISEEVQRDVPLLYLIANNLKPLVLFGPLVLAVFTGLVVSQQWETILKFLNAVPFGQADPIFHKDYSFYLFTLPLLTLVKSLLWETVVVLSIGSGMLFFFKRSVYLGPTGFVILPEARKTFSFLAALIFFLFALEFHLARYTLLMETKGVVAGIHFADYYGQLPVLGILTFIALLGGIISFANIFTQGMKKVVLPALVLGIVYIVGNIYPKILQKFIVDPNELVKETPFIEHTISGTLRGYGLENTETHVLTGAASLTAESIKKNAPTIQNIRLWDQGPLLDTLGQIQEIRTYYQFNSVDNDRYYINGTYQQTLLSPRELLSSSLPNRTWINEHLTFTHGYGVSLSPVNQVTTEGLPVLFIKDIPPRSMKDLTIERPEIYFGELSNDHVFVNTDTKEFDYPEGEKNVYRDYGGGGGFPVNSLVRKALLAARFKTLKILFSEDIKNSSRVLMYRNITERVQKAAPFLLLDNDPYLVISEGRLVWIYDAYTVSDQFPYSQSIAGFGNYIRNSVKIVIDAYEGNMVFYISDPTDPVILTYRNIFPDLFRDLKEIPEDLRKHLRYPNDLFTIQTFVYATFHMKTPQVFYNKEDQWEIPEIDGRTMRPYYTIMKLPGKEREEYIQMLPFTPRGKNNLSAWMVARSDGEDYGRLVVYTFPKQKLVYGPSQMVARINQNAEISRQISLWDQRGSSVIQGTLLVIPIEESLIYVRPLYLKADVGKIPELKRVIVGYEDQIAMEPTLEEALQKIFSGLTIEKPSARPEMAAAAQETPKPLASRVAGGNIVIRQSDFEKIKEYYERVQASQELLDQALSVYRKDIESLGRTLEETSVLTQPPVPPNP